MLVSPVILATLVVAIFFIPNLIGKWFVKPAVMAVQPDLYSHPSEVDVDVAAWHGFAAPELWMTVSLVGVGFILFLTMARWQKMYDIQPEYLSLNALYDSAMMFGEGGMNKLSRFYMTGLIRTYLIYMFAFIAAITAATLFIKEAFIVDMESFSPVNLYGVLTAIVLVIAVCMVLLAKTRLSAIIALGAVGYSVALFFVIFKAPDLALTQLVIETISVALFLLAFKHLPSLNNHGQTKRNKLGNLIIAAGVGITVTLVALSAHSQKLIPSISQYYKDTVATEAGGGNIVNVILVDYRGFDTLFEIAVLSIAGIAVLAMIRLKLSRKEESISYRQRLFFLLEYLLFLFPFFYGQRSLCALPVPQGRGKRARQHNSLKPLLLKALKQPMCLPDILPNKIAVTIEMPARKSEPNSPWISFWNRSYKRGIPPAAKAI